MYPAEKLTPVYICLGSNQGSRGAMLEAALEGIDGLPGCAVAAASRICLTEPQGLRTQRWFKNRIVKAMAGSFWDPRRFLGALLELERRLGRRRGPLRFGPRLIDIDLLLFGESRINEADCIVPHPRMLERAFVLAPLLELEPGLSVGGAAARAALDMLDWKKDGARIWQH